MVRAHENIEHDVSKLMYRRAMAARAFLYLIRNSFFVPQLEQAF
jgi:hypothetical protein